jgi:hypothetical protein
MSRQGDDLEAIAMTRDDVERAGADRTCCTQYDQAFCRCHC